MTFSFCSLVVAFDKLQPCSWWATHSHTTWSGLPSLNMFVYLQSAGSAVIQMHDFPLPRSMYEPSPPTKPFFSGLHTLPQGGCLPAFLEILGALSGITPPPPPVGVGQEWVGLFWGKYL